MINPTPQARTAPPIEVTPAQQARLMAELDATLRAIQSRYYPAETDADRATDAQYLAEVHQALAEIFKRPI